MPNPTLQWTRRKRRAHKLERYGGIKRSLRVARLSWRMAAVVGVTLGAVVAALLMYVAWIHNAQGEIHNGKEIEWRYWLLIGASWFVVSSVVISAISSTLFTAIRCRHYGPDGPRPELKRSAA